jgi:hypothetical protein
LKEKLLAATVPRNWQLQQPPQEQQPAYQSSHIQQLYCLQQQRCWHRRQVQEGLVAAAEALRQRCRAKQPRRGCSGFRRVWSGKRLRKNATWICSRRVVSSANAAAGCWARLLTETAAASYTARYHADL